MLCFFFFFCWKSKKIVKKNVTQYYCCYICFAVSDNQHKRILYGLSYTYQPSVRWEACAFGAPENRCALLCVLTRCSDVVVTYCKKNVTTTVLCHIFLYFFCIYFLCVIWFAYFLFVVFGQPTKKANQITHCAFWKLCVLVVFLVWIFYTFF